MPDFDSLASSENTRSTAMTAYSAPTSWRSCRASTAPAYVIKRDLPAVPLPRWLASLLTSAAPVP